MDLSPLDIGTDPERYEGLVRRILGAARPELERRAAAAGPLALVAGWARPTLAAAAIVAVMAVGALVVLERNGGHDHATMAEALGVPAPAASWLEEGREPTTSDLVLAMEDR